MSREQKTSRSKNVASQAAALCVGMGACWFVASLVTTPTRPLDAAASEQGALPTQIRLGQPSFSPAASAGGHAITAESSWKTPGQELQLVRTPNKKRSVNSPVLILSRNEDHRQQSLIVRPVSQSATQAVGANVAREYQKRAEDKREEWSVPGSHDPWGITQSTELAVEDTPPVPPISVTPPTTTAPPVPSSPQTGIGPPQPANSGVALPGNVKELTPTPQQAAATAVPILITPRNQSQHSGPPDSSDQSPQAASPPAIPERPDGGFKTFPTEPVPAAPQFIVPEPQPITNAVPATTPAQQPARMLPAPQVPPFLTLPESSLPQHDATAQPAFNQPYSAPINSFPQPAAPRMIESPGLQIPNGAQEIPQQPTFQNEFLPQPNQYAAPIVSGSQPFVPEVTTNDPSIADMGHAISPQQLFGHSLSGSFPGTSGFRATVESDAAHWMAPYSARAMNANAEEFSPVIPNIPEIPSNFIPWWNASVQKSLGVHASSHAVNVSSLLQDALEHSPQVVAIKTEPEVQYRVVTQEAAKFDWTAFLEATYDDLNDPVGSDLTTGNGEDRLLTRKALASGGFRRRNLEGGELRLAQDLGHENQNSRFFVPNNQGSTRLELSYRQPLLDGAGRAYNESEIVLARIQANSSEDDVVDALQGHLTEVTEAYWTLYRARAEFFQRQKLLASAQQVLVRLEGRSQVDTIPRQVLRARAAVARSQTRIQRTLARVRDAEAQLRLLVNSPAMLNGGHVELMPTEPPQIVTETADLQSVLQTALINRPDISEAIRKMRAAGVRLGVSKTELLPRLDFLVETYVADLAGNSDVQESFRGQFLDNRPGFTIGLEFEVPIGNRAAIAKREQREWELKRSVNIFRATVEKSLTDVEIANREVQTAYSEILSRYQSMKAADNESRYLTDRFEVLPAAEDSATLLLEDLLDSFERLADEESAFVQAQVDHAVALINLKKELGTLLRSRNSRPQLDTAHEAWMTQRLNDTEASRKAAYAINKDAKYQLNMDVIRPVSKSRTLPPSQHPPRSQHRPPSQGGFSAMPEQKPQRTEAYAPTSRDAPQGVPVPLTPTKWKRPNSSQQIGY